MWCVQLLQPHIQHTVCKGPICPGRHLELHVFVMQVQHLPTQLSGIRFGAQLLVSLLNPHFSCPMHVQHVKTLNCSGSRSLHTTTTYVRVLPIPTQRFHHRHVTCLFRTCPLRTHTWFPQCSMGPRVRAYRYVVNKSCGHFMQYTCFRQVLPSLQFEVVTAVHVHIITQQTNQQSTVTVPKVFVPHFTHTVSLSIQSTSPVGHTKYVQHTEQYVVVFVLGDVVAPVVARSTVTTLGGWDHIHKTCGAPPSPPPFYITPMTLGALTVSNSVVMTDTPQCQTVAPKLK